MIKIHCSICNKYLKDINETEIKTLTGKEICTGCEQKIQDKFKDIEIKKKQFLEGLNDLNSKAKKDFSKLDQIYATYVADSRNLFTATIAELKNLVADIRKGE